jgi:hypothetical protein
MSQTEKSVVPFAPTDRGNDQLDKAGHSILSLLHKAAGVAEKNSQQAMEMAQKLSHQLRAAEQRITEQSAQSSGFTRFIRKSKNALYRELGNAAGLA